MKMIKKLNCHEKPFAGKELNIIIIARCAVVVT